MTTSLLLIFTQVHSNHVNSAVPAPSTLPAPFAPLVDNTVTLLPMVFTSGGGTASISGSRRSWQPVLHPLPQAPRRQPHHRIPRGASGKHSRGAQEKRSMISSHEHVELFSDVLYSPISAGLVGGGDVCDPGDGSAGEVGSGTSPGAAISASKLASTRQGGARGGARHDLL